MSRRRCPGKRNEGGGDYWIADEDGQLPEPVITFVELGAILETIDERRANLRATLDGETGTWVKMEDAKNGAPTPGLKPLGHARTHWHGLFKDQLGAIVSIASAQKT
jgi:hypothetical protein